MTLLTDSSLDLQLRLWGYALTGSQPLDWTAIMCENQLPHVTDRWRDQTAAERADSGWTNMTDDGLLPWRYSLPGAVALLTRGHFPNE